MKCIHCQKEVYDNDKYCPQCGHEIKRCPHCHSVIKDNSQFCAYCGRVLQSQGYYEPIKETDEYIEREIVKPEVKSKKVNLFVVIISIVVLIAATAGSYYYMDKTPEVDITAGDSSNESKDYQVGSDVLEATHIANINEEGLVYSYKDYIFICDENGSIYRYDHELENKQQIIDGQCSYIQVYNDILYYADENMYLCSCDLNGDNQQVLLNEAVYYVVVKDGFVYYQLDSDHESIYSYHIDSKKNTKLNDRVSYNINIVDNYIYYLSTDGIYRMDLDGKNDSVLLDDQGNSINGHQVVYYNKGLYYIDSNLQMTHYDINTKKTTVLIDELVVSYNITEEYIFYVDYNYRYAKSYDLRTKEVNTIYTGMVNRISVLDGILVLDTKLYNKNSCFIVTDYTGEDQYRLFVENDDNYI